MMIDDDDDDDNDDDDDDEYRRTHFAPAAFSIAQNKLLEPLLLGIGPSGMTDVRVQDAVPALATLVGGFVTHRLCNGLPSASPHAAHQLCGSYRQIRENNNSNKNPYGSQVI
eukprot:TRINITY_DN1547_c0_g1_i12.p4 TRINITY_DN1547_c0_g1~~TRINITY_DN1547_c0_g1_i12.p4  ORF type:complete len:112 (+),score=22.22 TRINITY_DN1547_c0_g1_i12:1394-1729(+)